MEWQGDILGEGFESHAFDAVGADGVTRTATLVRYSPLRETKRHPPQDSGRQDSRRQDSGRQDIGRQNSGRQGRRAVLFLHGWSDYFFNTELARFWHSRGFSFFALDMHNHGRSLQPEEHGGYVADLSNYDAEIDTAVGMIRDLEPGASLELVLMGHSTGGLVAALWVSRHPGVVSQLVLNSPWLEMHGSALGRRAAWTMVEPLARLKPEAVLRLPERGFYWRSISSSAEGEWALDDRYRPPMAFPVRAGWLSAVLAGHAQVARGLGIGIPILVLISGSSSTGPFWREEMRSADAVLDVHVIAVRALSLGSSVTVERIDGALHDVFLSRAEVRADAYRRLERWIRGYTDA